MDWPSRLVPKWLKKKRVDQPNFSAYWVEIVAALSQQQYDPDAQRGYELFAGCFTWSDELPDYKQVDKILYLRLTWFMRYFNGYRASLILGQPDERYKNIWEDIKRDCPSWPALRPERTTTDLCAELEEETKRQVAAIEHLLDVCDRSERIAKIREHRKAAGD